jgi:DNA modification methylase
MQMIPAVEIGGARVFLGDCRDVLKTLPDNSVDSIVTDPPYELGFMGKKWDSSGIAYDVTVWEECLRVLKPGGHVLAFGGSRTWHRLAVAVEDAGFELRDSIAWIYGSGFPKSLDVSKAIDKKAPRAGMFQEFAAHFAERWEGSGMKRSELWPHFQHYKNAESIMAQLSNWKLGKNVPSVQDWLILKPMLGLSDNFMPLIERVEAEREVIGQKTFVRNTQSWETTAGMLAPGLKKVRETLPATSEAQKWQGWGTALKPAFEPVVVGRKPLVGTVAENVLQWGVGGLNIDGSRIGYKSEQDGGDWDRFTGHQSSKTIRARLDGNDGADLPGRVDNGKQAGRWPANVILDEVSAGLLDEQSGVSRDGVAVKENSAGRNIFSEIAKPTAPNQGYGGQGGASRFFYVAKASKRDRNEGLEELEAVSAGHMVDRVEGSAGMDSPRAGAGRTSGAKNFHPTVKPTQLMRYLIKLVTPAGGTVLDPFTGSGSTGKAALLDGYGFIGAELTEEYLPIIEGRLRWASEQVEDEDVTLF